MFHTAAVIICAPVGRRTSRAPCAEHIRPPYAVCRNGFYDFRLAYAIGLAEPLEKTVIVDGKPEEIEGYDLTPAGIIKALDLRRPIYEPTARHGHFGEGFDWDK